MRHLFFRVSEQPQVALDQASGHGVQLQGLKPAEAFLAEEVLDVFGERDERLGEHGVDAVLDVVGGALFEPCLKSLALRGRHVAIASQPERKVTFDLVDFYHNESSLRGVDSIKIPFSEVDRILRLLLPYFESGDFAPPKELIPVCFGGALNAYRELTEGRAAGKYVIVPETNSP